MTAPRVPSLDDLEREFGIGDTGGARRSAAAPKFDDLEREFGVSGDGAPDTTARVDDAARNKAAIDLLRRRVAKGGASIAATRPDATAVRGPGKAPANDDIDQVREGIGQVGEAIRHPLRTAGGMVTSAVQSAAEAFDTPVVGERVTAARANRGKGGNLLNASGTQPKAGRRITKAETPGAITNDEFHRAGLNTVANVALPVLPGGPLMRVTSNAALGALNDPEKPLRGATAGVGLGEVLHQAATRGPGAIKAVRRAAGDRPGAKAASLLGLREGRAPDEVVPANGPQNGPDGRGGTQGASATDPAAAGQSGAETGKLRRRLADIIDPTRHAERQELTRAANIDALTGVANRRAYELARPAAEADPNTAVVRFDLNGFKAVNDTHGHAAGDAALQAVPEVMRQAARDVGVPDRVFRTGGDEFGALIPRELGEAFRDRVEALYGVVDHGAGVRTSISGGVSATDAAADALAQARKAQHKAAQGIASRTPDSSGRVTELPVASIARDPSRFQFKQNVDAEGVGRELKSVEKYNPQLAGVLSVWKDPQNGQTYIVNGHHRLELAQRTNHPTVTVQYLDAPTAAAARAQGALVNIAEGRGTPLDAAQFFRDTGLGPDLLAREGVSLSGAVAKHGLALSKLDSSVFDRVARGRLSETHGALIGTYLDDPAQQVAAADLIEHAPRTPNSAEVAEIAKQVRAAGTVDATQESLFGTEALSRSLIRERATIAAEVQRRLSSDKRLFQYVGQEGRAAELARAGNTINVEGSRQIGDQAAALLEAFSAEAHRSGPVGSIITEAAQRIARGEKPKAVASDIYPAIRDAVRASVAGRGAERGSALAAGDRLGEPPAGRDALGRQDAHAPPEEAGRVADSTDPAQDALFAPAPDGPSPFDDLEAQYGLAPQSRLHGAPDRLTTPGAASEHGPMAPASESGAPQVAVLSPASAPTPNGSALRRAMGLTLQQNGDVVALRSISVNLAKALDVPLHEGRGNLKRMRALGAFWTKPEVIRVRRLKQVDTVAHEIGHFLSKSKDVKTLVHGLPAADRRVMRQELVAAGKRLYGNRKPNGGYAEEGIAEWAKFYVTDPARMAAEFPNFVRLADDLLAKNPALKAAMDQARADFARFEAAPANAKLRSMIADKLPARFQVSPEQLVDYIFDDLAPIRRATEQLGASGDPARDAYMLARLAKGNAGRARDMIDHGWADLVTRERRTSGLAEILRPVRGDMGGFTEYLVARQVLTKTAQGIDTGFDVNAARQVVEAAEHRPEFAAAADQLWQFRAEGLRYLEAAGLLLPEERAAITANNPTPTPFYRAFDPDERAGRGGGGSAKARNSSGVYRLRGSDRPILNPIESIIADTYNIVDRAQNHAAAATLIRTALDTDGGGRIAELLPEAPKTRAAIPLSRVAEQLVDAGWSPPPSTASAAGLDAAVLETFYEKSTLGGREARDMVMPVLLDGKRRWVQINDRALWDAVQGMSQPELSVLERVLSAPTRTLRLGATQLNPDFALVNPARDAFAAAVYSRGGTRPPGYHIARGLFHLVRSKLGHADAIYERWAQEGGENAGVVGTDARAIRSEYQRTLQELTNHSGEQIARAIRHPIHTTRQLFEALENATRVGEFAATREAHLRRGVPEIEASQAGALASRNATLDFARAGSQTRRANRYIAFLTAHLNDIAQLSREHNPLNLKTAEGRGRMGTVVARASAMITVPSVMLYLLQRDDPDFQETPEWIKATSWVIVDHDDSPGSFSYTLPSGRKTRLWVIPRPHLLGYIYGYMPEKVLSWLDERDPEALSELAKQSWSVFTPPVIPTLAVPIIEHWGNKSLLTGRKIVPGYAEKRDPEEQVRPETGELARLLGHYTRTSPAVLENYARGYTGGAGAMATDAVDAGIRQGRRLLKKPSLRQEPPGSVDPLDRTPVIGRFIIDPPGVGSKSLQTVLSRFDEAEAKRKTWRSYVEGRQHIRAAQYLADHRAEILSVATAEDAGEPGALRRLHTEIVGLQRQRAEVARSPLPPEQKRPLLRKIDDALVRIARTQTHPTARLGASR